MLSIDTFSRIVMCLELLTLLINPRMWFDFYFRAKDRGLEPYWTINHGWISGIYYRDPDGNLVEIFYEHWRNEEEFRTEVGTRGFPEEPEFHHDLHHKAYVDNGNKLLAGTDWESKRGTCSNCSSRMQP